ncbi:enoyl-CoA hydratase/isomerase family protein [Azospirillum oleiclasticum]|nr:enoyl-CoA hydratase/isomerase family protein [Azospirillum oleiclasticum]
MNALVLTERMGSILRVTINRADKRNALSRDTLVALKAAFEAHAGDRTLTAAVLTGAGDRAFAAGGDLHELQGLVTAEAIEEMTLLARAALDSVRRFPVPVVAALNGDAFGGGAELAMACDLRLAAAHIRIAFLQGRLAIPTAWGGGIDLMRLVGTARAMELLASSRMVPAAEAVGLGLASAVAPADIAFDAFIMGWLEGWSHQRPQVMRAFKAQALAERLGLPRAEREAAELAGFVESWLHEDHVDAAARAIAGMRSAPRSTG